MRALTTAAILLFVSHISAPSSTDTASPIRFSDATESAGIRFRHWKGASGRHYLVETFAGGVIVFDYDGDGLPDIYFVNGGRLPGFSGPEPDNTLYRNQGDGTFIDVTEKAGVAGKGYCNGGVAADYDDDGDTDLYVTAFGADIFYRNNGDGTFTDVTAETGLGDDRWSTSATFFDFDGDPFLDLFVCNYTDFDFQNHKLCTDVHKGIEGYCHPDEYNGTADLLYRNRGNGAFDDVSAAAGVENPAEGKGLGVVACDFNNDGRTDLYVANDNTRNFLYRNEGDGRLTDIGFEAGVGFNEDGFAESGMGTDCGDVDRDGAPDLIVTNYDFESNTLYRNLANGFFLDYTAPAGLANVSTTELAFGVDLADLDNDGWLDLILVNGHIMDNIHHVQSNLSYRQPGQFFRNRGGGRFEDRSAEAGEALRKPRVGRAMATLDFDRDGDLDVAVTNNDEEAELLRNEGGNANAWVGLRLVGAESNREGVGTRVEARVNEIHWMEEVRTASSFQAQNELTLYVGLGSLPELTGITLRWPSGNVDRLPPLPAGSVYLVKEGIGVLGTVP